MTRAYISTHVVNERLKPRLLVCVADRGKYAWVEARAGTSRYIDSLDEVDADEWDAIITDRSTSEYHLGQHGMRSGGLTRLVPPNLNTFRVLIDGRTARNALLDFGTVDGGSRGTRQKDEPLSVLDRVSGVPGHQVRRVENLTEPLQHLVKTSLVPAVEGREYQFGVRMTDQPEGRPPGISNLRPFLVGPQEIILACSYRRLDGSQHWIVPDDLADLANWFDLALAQWHEDKPETFPGDGVWQSSDRWMTNAERELSRELTLLDERFREARDTHEIRRQALSDAFVEVREGAKKGRRALLTGQDDVLQDAVLEALVELGFDVDDMDKKWAPRERREDFRIRDSDDPTWVAIADATGVTKGAKASKLQTIGGYVTKFVLEERPESVPAQWLVVNRLIDRDPSTRGDVFRGDEIRAFADADGLAFDTAALFVLAEACSLDPTSTGPLRAWLRGLKGQLTLEMAEAWISVNEPTEPEVRANIEVAGR
jgi:hypothetical protein